MFDPIDRVTSPENQIPTWLARDLGVHPWTRLGNVRSSSRRTSSSPTSSDGNSFTRAVRARRRRKSDDVTAAIPLFEGFSKKQRRSALQHLTKVELPAGAMLTQEGASGDEFFVVLEGEVEVFQGGHVVATRGPGSPLGEVALLDDTPRTATLVAKTPVSTLVSGRQEFRSLIIELPQISERLRTITEERRAA